MADASGLRTLGSLSAKVKTHLFSQSCLISLVTHHVLSEPQTAPDSPVLPKHYLEEVFNTFWIIAVTFPADSFHFFNLSCLACSLNVLEVHIWILAEVYNGAQEIKQTWRKTVHTLFASLAEKYKSPNPKGYRNLR